MIYLLDTCTILWAISAADKLSAECLKILKKSDSDIRVSAISCAEIACAQANNKIKLKYHWRKWFRHYIKLNNWTVEPISLEVIEEAYSLQDPFHKDPADRIIVATARVLRCSVITADRKILSFPYSDSINALK